MITSVSAEGTTISTTTTATATITTHLVRLFAGMPAGNVLYVGRKKASLPCAAVLTTGKGLYNR